MGRQTGQNWWKEVTIIVTTIVTRREEAVWNGKISCHFQCLQRSLCYSMFRFNISSSFFFLQIYVSAFLFASVKLEEISDVTESTFENNGESLLPEDHQEEEEEVPNTRQGKAAEPVPAPPLGCTEQDHRSCDDVCKGDSFWYGYCGSWDGRDFQCTCLAYKEPLNGTVCGPERQENCASECREKGQEAGGYCAVFPSAEDTRGEPKCMCFEKPALN